ncbi:unnamed protein product [Thlaspi arvense]|uniref:Uncharacterized protein n=1 Tax=Thlaspi arvense TaxID=13288 RepID=A0AAU9SY27_THLAR|nr:unnamed protein product [Thlaspi arvense]
MVAVSWCLTKQGMKTIDRATRNYMQELNKSEGFDVGGLQPSLYVHALLETICNDTCSPLVLLYAKMGLHRYNLLQGKNLQLISVKKYNRSTGSAASCYYITLEAMDPATNLPRAFQTRVQELSFGELILSAGIARPLGETKRSDVSEIKKSSDHKPVKNFLLVKSTPKWPRENPFENSKRCHVLKDSELQENKDWISLYLELAVAATNRDSLEDHDLSHLKIIKVAIDTSTQDVEEGLKNAKYFAIVYIRYKDSCEARVGKDVDRVAVVRRAFNERHGCFSLLGQTLSSDILPKKRGKKQLLFSLRFKPWRLLFSPRRRKAYKHSGLGFSRRLRKTRTIEYVDNEEKTECFNLVGQDPSSEIIPKKGKKRSAEPSPTPWRLKACKYSGLGDET